MTTWTASSVTAANLLQRPSTSLVSGGLYALIFQAGIGPIFADEDVFTYLEQGGDVSSLPPIAKQGSIWGLAVKIRQPPAHPTVQGAFGDWANGFVPAFAEASLTLIAVVPIGSPAEAADVTLATASSDLNAGFLGIGTEVSNTVKSVSSAVGSTVSTAVKDLIVVLVLVLLIVLAFKFFHRATSS